MFLQKLELKGFKSFVDKTILEFNALSKTTDRKGVTAIIGPNGSGKSNIADAVRWVFGEQSSKLLRVKKIEDVIFAGTDKKAQLGFCQVDLYLNNEDRSIPIDYLEVIITRRLYRDGESEYLINKNKVKLQDITMLLAKSNFGQKNYSIIGQGMIDSILITSPQEKKEFFEEATGIKQYQIKREQSLHKFKNSKENLQQGKLLLQEIEPRLKLLTRQIKKLERKEIIEKELKEMQIQYYFHLWKELDEKWKIENEKWKIENEKEQIIKNELENIQEKLEFLEKENSREEIFQKLQNEYNVILENRNSLLRKQTILNGKIDLEYQKNGQQDLIWLKNRQIDSNKQLMSIEENLLKIEKNIKNKKEFLKQELNKEKNIIIEINEIEKKILENKNQLETKISLSISEISDELEKIYKLQQNFIDQINKIDTIEEVQKIKTQARIITQKMADFAEKLKTTPSSKYKFQEEILEYQKKLNQFLNNKSNLIDKINNLKIDLEIEKERKKLIENKKNEIQESLVKIIAEIKENEAMPADKKEALIIFEKENKKIEEEIKEINQEFKKIEAKINNFNKEEQEKKENLFVLQKSFQDKQKQFNQISTVVNEIKIELTKLETKEEDLKEEIIKEIGENELENIQKNRIDLEILEKQFTFNVLSNDILRLKHQLALIGGIDLETTKEYQETKKRYDFLLEQSEDLNKTIESLETIIIELDKIIEKQFKSAFEKINQKFEKYFKILFNGGEAKLVLIKEKEDVNNELDQEQTIDEETSSHFKEAIATVEIYAIPPGKRLKNINTLSGGEKALTSIALICAIIANNPPPFIILDEVDAALDEANSERFIKILDDLSHKTQFIIITHNRASMEKAEILYGVTMNSDEGISKILSIKLEKTIN